MPFPPPTTPLRLQTFLVQPWLIASLRREAILTNIQNLCFFKVLNTIFLHNLWLLTTSLAKVSWQSNCHYNEFSLGITKTYLYNFDPLKPHFYIVKLGFTGVYIIFLISAQNIDCGYSLEPPRRGGSNEYPQSMFWAEIWKISEFFLSGNFQVLEVKFSIYLNRRVYVMVVCICSWHYITLNSIHDLLNPMSCHLKRIICHKGSCKHLNPI